MDDELDTAPSQETVDLSAPITRSGSEEKGDAFDRYLDATVPGPKLVPEDDENKPEAPEAPVDGEDTTDPQEDPDGKDDDAAAAAGDQSPQSEEGRFVAANGKVRLADGSVTTVEQLMRGNLREADYTRSKQDLAQKAQVVAAKEAELEQTQSTIALAIEVLQYVMPEAPDPALISTDPIGYLQQQEAHKGALAQLQQLQQANLQKQAAQEQAQQKNMETWAASELVKAKQALPELENIETAKRYRDDLVSAISHYGFTPQEADGIIDHRFLKMGKDLIAYRKMLAQKPTAMAKVAAKPPISPQARTSPAAAKGADRQADWKRLKETGGKDSAAFDRLIDNLI